jgi:calcium-dependent protein kinase
MRLTAEEAYNHPWIQQQKNKENSNVQVNKEVFENMENYMNAVQLKRTTLSLIASRIPEDQIILLR